jgi:gamma-glutamylputrescine oxidase
MTPVSFDPARDSLSYWHATSKPLIPSDELPARGEVVIIGGGLLGCWTAYWLAKAGLQPVVLERTAIGWGATGRNGGFLVGGTALSYPHLVDTVGPDAARGLHQLTLDGQKLAYAVVAEEGVDCELRQAGTLSLALDGAAMEETRYGGALLVGDGFGVEMLDRSQVQELIATPLGDRIVGGWFAPGDGVLHSSRYLAGIARAAQRNGARLVQAEVSAVTPNGNGVRLETSASPIEAGQVVIALNAWSDTLVPALVGRVVPTRGQILAYEPIAPVFGTAVGVDVTPTGEYWQQRPDGSIVIGGCRADAPHEDLDVREMVPTPDVTARIEQVLPTLFPELTGLRVARRWAGLMAFTSDHLPVADAVPGLANAWVVGGFSGHGMPYGPILGQLLADAVTTGRKPTELAPLRIDRPSLRPLVAATA